MKKRLGSVIQTAVALLLCLATALCVTQLQIGRAPQEEAHAASRMLLSQGEVLYDGDRIAGMDSANDGEDQENDTPDEPDMPEEPDTPEDQQTVQDHITEMNRTLPLYKRIGAVEFSETPLPRNATGKLVR